MSEIVWEDPPEDGRRRRTVVWRVFLKALAERPGEWAVYKRDTDASVGAKLRELGGRMGLEVEVTSRRDPETKIVTVWARVLEP